MDPRRLDGMLRIFVLFGAVLLSAPYLLGFPHDARYCSDLRLGQDVLSSTGLIFLAVALVVRCATFSWMTPIQRRWLVPMALAAGFVWFLGPVTASLGMYLLGR